MPRLNPAEDVEQNIIAASLLSEDVCIEALAELNVEDFYDDRHRVIWKTMQDISLDGRIPTLSNIVEYLRMAKKLTRVGGVTYISSITDIVPGVLDIKEQCQFLRGHATVMRCREMADGIKSYEDPDALIAYIQTEMDAVLEHASSDTANYIGDAAVKVVDIAQAIHDGKTTAAGIKTGFDGIDRYFTRMSPGDLIILAARPGVGKSALATNIATNAAVGYDKSVLFVSLEMTTEEIAARVIGSLENVNTMSFKTGKFDTSGCPNDLDRIHAAKQKLANKNLVIDDRGCCTVPQVKALARKLKARHGGLDLIVIDYVQLMEGPGDNRTNIVGGVSRGLKQLAKDLSVPILCLSQLRRKGRSMDDPEEGHSLDELRESGNLEQDADKVLFVLRPENSREAHFQIAKHRGGPMGWAVVKYIPEYTRFENYTHE
jgi:replicative DNA helicase